MALDGALLGEIREYIGDETPPSDSDLEAYWDDLGSVEAVALRVLRKRYASMRAQAAEFTAEGDYRENWSKNLDALKADISTLQAAVGAAGETSNVTVTVGTITRAGRCR